MGKTAREQLIDDLKRIATEPGKAPGNFKNSFHVRHCAAEAARLLEQAAETLAPFKDAYAKHNDPGIIDLDDEQRVAWHVPLGAYRRLRYFL